MTIYKALQKDAKCSNLKDAIRYHIAAIDYMATREKDPIDCNDDSVIITYFGRFIKDLQSNIDILKTRENINPDALDIMVKEMEYLKSYMPKVLSNDEVKQICEDNGLNDIKSAMTYLKANYFKQYDAKFVSTLFTGK